MQVQVPLISPRRIIAHSKEHGRISGKIMFLVCYPYEPWSLLSSKLKISVFDRKSGISGAILISDRLKPSHVVRKIYNKTFYKVSFMIIFQIEA